jgi:hypothetical protein
MLKETSERRQTAQKNGKARNKDKKKKKMIISSLQQKKEICGNKMPARCIR